MDPLILLSIIAAAIVVMIISTCVRISLPASRVTQFLKEIENNGSPDLPARSDWDEKIALDSNGVTIIPLSDLSKPRLTFKWTDVMEVTAYKIDLWAYDRVCLAFCLADRSEIQANEGMKGWEDLCQTLPDSLPGAPPWEGWFMPITNPAFAPDPTCLFQRRP